MTEHNATLGGTDRSLPQVPPTIYPAQPVSSAPLPKRVPNPDTAIGIAPVRADWIGPTPNPPR
jgi:hypothetical protein